MQVQNSNLTIIMYNARKDQTNVYWQGQGKWSQKVQEQHREYLIQSWELSTLVFGSLFPQTDQWEMTKFTLRKKNPGQFITLLHGKQGLEAGSSWLYFPDYLKYVFYR